MKLIATSMFQVLAKLLGLAVFLISGLPVLASPSGLASKGDDWFKTSEGKSVVTNVLSWQSSHGSWPKNRDTSKDRFKGDRGEIKGTFDNGATTGELRFLARAFTAGGDVRCREGVTRGIDHILNAQYSNGGWPQYFPLSEAYHRHITYNDGTMKNLLELVKDVNEHRDFRFLDVRRKSLAAEAFAKGLDCILKTQVEIDGRLTVWCAQHDEVTLAPAPARIYEHASLSGSESAGLLRFLMTLENPSPEIKQAIRAGVAWFEQSAIKGIRVERKGGDTRVRSDIGAPDVWARFYEIPTNRPIFSGRDGVVRYRLSEIDRERRGGYAWYGNWGHKVQSAYQKWDHRKERPD